ncbi:MAG: lipopolysaccharide heptosyltransferase I [Campylobacterales bacterium]|nr:lipopolysaccharide heptosyltransferase I [Campylobacterales bacterium]
MKIALVKLSALGDIVHASVVLQHIHAHYPDAQIDWVVEERFAPLLEGHPHLRHVHGVALKEAKRSLKNAWQQWRFLRSLQREHYDVVIDLQGLIKSALVSKALGGACVAGFSGRSTREWPASVFYDVRAVVAYEENVIVRNVKLVCEALELPFDLLAIDNKTPCLFSQTPLHVRLAKERPNVLLVLGSSWPSKVYPKEKMAIVAQMLGDASVWMCWGSEGEKEMAQWIAGHTHAQVLPRLSLPELVTLVGQCALVIGPDSGPTHVAWAQNRPSITLFGPTPSMRNTYATPVNVSVECGKKIDARRLDKHEMCIKMITPEVIVARAKELLYG